MFDPYERKRRLAWEKRQQRLEQVADPELPVDGDPVETRRPTQSIGGMLDAVLDSMKRDLYQVEAQFFDRLNEQWDSLFPGCPARPGRWQTGKLILYVANAGQSFAMRPKLPAMKRKIRALEGAPKGNLALLVEIRGDAAKRRESP